MSDNRNRFPYRGNDQVRVERLELLATKISFINEVARFATRWAQAACAVADGWGLTTASAVKISMPEWVTEAPVSQRRRGLDSHGWSAGLHPQLLKAVVDINDDQRRWAVNTLEHEMSGLEGKTVGRFGD